jgi:hypothetical protein
MLDSQSGVSGILGKNIGPLIRTSIAWVRNPDLVNNALFNQGIGGNDQEVPARSLAYPITMFETAQKLQEVYAVHTAKSMFELENQRTPNENELTLLEEAAIKNPKAALDIDDSLKNQFGVPSSLPTVEVFSGAEAAIKMNGGVDAVKIRQNSAAMIEATQDMASTLYPDVPFQTRSLLPWKEKASSSEQETLSPVTELAFEYLADTLLQSNDASVVKLRQDIMKMGGKRGTTEEISALYAAVHAPTFGDDLRIALGNIFDTPRDTESDERSVVVSYGAWPERVFDGIRQFMIENCTKDRQLGYLKGLDKRIPNLIRQIDKQISSTEQDDAAVAILESRKEELEAKKAGIPALRDAVAKEPVAKGPLFGSIMLLLDHCENPPYYTVDPVAITVTNHDIPAYTPVEPFVVHNKAPKDQGRTTIKVIGKTEDDKAIYERTKVDREGQEVRNIYSLTDEVVAVDIPLNGFDIRNPYQLQDHITRLEGSLDRALTASDSDKRLKADSGLQIRISRMKAVLADYKVLYNATRCRFYAKNEEASAAK